METTNTPTPMMPAILYFSVRVILSSERPIFILLCVFFQVRPQGKKMPACRLERTWPLYCINRRSAYSGSVRNRASVRGEGIEIKRFLPCSNKLNKIKSLTQLYMRCLIDYFVSLRKPTTPCCTVERCLEIMERISFTFCMIISDHEGEQLVKVARQAVETFLIDNIVLSIRDENSFAEKMGVFVTLIQLNDKTGQEGLRGCIGFPLPEKQLFESVVEAAITAATGDPRFPALAQTELPRTVFEVSILTPLELIQVKHPSEYYEHIKVGRDGLVLRWERGSGLLLPQVAEEMGWDIDDYLSNICYKAGAAADTWVMPTSKLYKFQAFVYREVEPKGKVIRLR